MPTFTDWENLVNETSALTRAIAEIGSKTRTLPDWGIHAVDCPSTGGSGNKLPIIVPPLVIAAAEELSRDGHLKDKIVIPKMSTRGLPGGTIDILESIGYQSDLSLGKYVEIIQKCGFSNIRPTRDLAPVDEMLMKLRKKLGLMRHPELVVASILGKKLATKCSNLVIEVKAGIESKMRFPGLSLDEGARLGAHLFLDVGRKLGMQVICLITDGDRPQGCYIGNKLALREVIAVLQGMMTKPRDQALLELSKQTAWEMLRIAGVDEHRANSAISQALNSSSGRANSPTPALSKLIEQMKLHGATGVEQIVREVINGIPVEKSVKKKMISTEVEAATSGTIMQIGVKLIDECAKELIVKHDRIADYEAGIVFHRLIGNEIKKGGKLATIYCATDRQARLVPEMVQEAFTIKQAAMPPKHSYLRHKISREADRVTIYDWDCERGRWRETPSKV